MIDYSYILFLPFIAVWDRKQVILIADWSFIADWS